MRIINYDGGAERSSSEFEPSRRLWHNALVRQPYDLYLSATEHLA